MRPALHCEATKRDGTPCGAPAHKGSTYCYGHDPACREALLEAARRGGIASHERKCVPPGEPTIDLRTAEDVRALISSTVSKLQAGELDRNIASTTLYAAQTALKAIDVAELERRIAALEEARRPRGKSK